MNTKKKDIIKFISASSKEATVEDVMQSVNLYVDNEYDIDFSTFNFEDEFSECIDDLLSANQKYVINIDRIEYSIGKLHRFKNFIKRVIRKCIYWYIKDINAQQTEFNAYSTRVLNQQFKLINELYKKNQQLEETLKNFQEKEEVREDSLPNEQPYDNWYLNFENHFRGNESEIEQRLLRYIPYFNGLNNIVDLGCGRGEFLSIMSEKGFKVSGVDVNKSMVDKCLKKGLKVTHKDCLEFLEEQQDRSLGGIFSSQVVEHLSLFQLRKLIQLSYEKLSPKGILILETVNPMALGVFCYGFYIDPTHSTPVHPSMLRYMVEQQGFTSVEVHFINAFPEEYHLNIEDDMQKGVKEAFSKLDNLIFGYQDYYLLCKK